MSSVPDQAAPTTSSSKRPASPAPDDSNSKARFNELSPTTSTSTDAPPAPLAEMGNSDSKPTESAPAAAGEPAPPADSAESTTESTRTPGIDPQQLDSLATLYSQGKLEGGEASAFEHVAALNDKVVLWRGDITTLAVDCIVNAANKSLLGGGGVDGAIHSAAGPGLYDECALLDGAETGEVKLTTGHDLPAKHVAHAVGPIYSRNRKEWSEEMLRSCYRGTLELAVEKELRTIAFSGISTGIYGYPLDDATRTALDEVRKFLEGPSGSKIDIIIFTVFRQIDVDSYVEFLPEFFPPAPAPTTSTTEPSSDATTRPGPAPIEIEPTPPSAGADSSDLVESNSVKDESTTAISVDEGSKKPVGVPKALASVKLGSEVEENNVETVVGDLPVEEK
ncbi:hypothetical protein BCR35DRAFT_305131, partial [Leucosporidium creatinivorum]